MDKMNKMDKKILIAIDGSAYSSNSLDYLIRLFKNNESLSVHLLSIISSAAGDQSWMFDVDPLRQHSPATERRRSTAEKYLKDARARLVRNGFNENNITFRAEITSASIATAIHAEANRGAYDGLLIGRRGIGKVGEMFFGSVSSYLVEKCHDVPLWIIDGAITSAHFLLAVQTKPHSLMAADYLGYIIKNEPGSKILLYHSSVLFGGKAKTKVEDFHDPWGKDWCDQHIDLDTRLYHAHTQILLDNGIEAERIHALPTRTDLEASRDLLRQARKHQCGTIVIGRRPRSEDKGIFGGVSDRALQQAEDIALWLVG